MSQDHQRLTLDLERMRHANSLTPGHTLHEREVRRVLGLIRDQVSGLDDPAALLTEGEEAKKRLRHRHDAILVEGPRGAGKTTLLLTVSEALRPHRGGSDARSWIDPGPQGNDWPMKVHALDPLDPTLVEGDEVFLGTIVANVLRALNGRHRNQLWTKYPRLRDAFEKMGKSLRVLAPDASQKALKEAASSPDLFAERLLSNAMSGLDLAACFHDFCIAACDALGVRLLVQPIDDADVSISQGWDVLETVRRYLSNAHILPIMLGDLALFRLVIEQQQRERLDKLRDGPGVLRQVAELSEQYLLKLLRPERRVRLPGAVARLESMFESGWDVRLEPERGPGEGATATGDRLADVLTAVGKKVFGIANARADQLLGLLSDNARELRGVLVWMTRVHGRDGIPAPEVMQSYLAVFNRALVQLELSADVIDALMDGRLDPWMRWLTHAESDSREPLWALDLQPDNLDAELPHVRALKFTLSGVLFLRWQRHPGEQLRYFGAVLSPMLQWPEPGEKYAERATAFRERLRLGRGEPSWLTAARVTVHMIGPSGLTKTASGSHTVTFGPATRLPPRSIYRKAETYGRVVDALLRHTRAKGKKQRLGVEPWLEVVAKHKQPKNRAVEDLVIPVLDRWRRDAFGDAQVLLSWFSVTPRRFSRTYELIDPWKGIAAIGDLVRAWPHPAQPTAPSRGEDERGPGGGATPAGAVQDDEGQSNRVLEALVQRILAQSELSIPIDDLNASDAPTDTLDQMEGVETSGLSVEISPGLLDGLRGWIVASKGRHAAMTPAGWAQVAQRFGENLHRLQEDLSIVEHSVGADLERWVLAFLHNVLYVEVGLRGKAPTDRDKRLADEFNLRARDIDGKIQRVPFSTNLARVTPREFPVFFWLAQCPILTAVLHRDWRAHLAAALNRGRPDAEPEVVLRSPEGEWARPISETVDVHTALCALVPRFVDIRAKDEDIPTTLGALREKIRALLGWDGDGADGTPESDDAGDDNA